MKQKEGERQKEKDMESWRKKPNGGLGAWGAEAAPRFFLIEISYVLSLSLEDFRVPWDKVVNHGPRPSKARIFRSVCMTLEASVALLNLELYSYLNKKDYNQSF